MKKTICLLALLFVAMVVLMVSCSKSNEEDMSSEPPPGCDTANMKYSAHIVPILQGNCYSCHGSGNREGGISLDSYEDVKERVNNGSLVGAITHSPGYTPMPYQQPKMSDCNINKIKAWVNNGAPNN